jgi:hypothetical protein
MLLDAAALQLQHSAYGLQQRGVETILLYETNCLQEHEMGAGHSILVRTL